MQTTVVRADTDPAWVDIVAGVPAWTADGRIAWTADSAGTRRLVVATPEQHAAGAAEPVTPPGLQVRQVLDTDGDAVLFTASGEDPAADRPVAVATRRPHPIDDRLTGSVRGGGPGAPR